MGIGEGFALGIVYEQTGFTALRAMPGEPAEVFKGCFIPDEKSTIVKPSEFDFTKETPSAVQGRFAADFTFLFHNSTSSQIIRQ